MMRPAKKGLGSDKNQAGQVPDNSQPSADTPDEADRGFDDHLDWLIDQAIIESFPASDPPCWTLGREQTAEADPQQPIHKDTKDSTETDEGAEKR